MNIGVQNVSIKYRRVSANSLCTIILYMISEIVIAGNIIRHEGISVAYAIWFLCSKLPMLQPIS